MSEIKMVIDNILEVADKLNDNNLKETIETVKASLKNTGKLRLTIVGQESIKLHNILAALLSKAELFDKFPKTFYKSYMIEAKYSEAENYKVISGDGGLNVTKEVFKNYLTADSETESNFKGEIADSETESIFKGEINVSSELLKFMDIAVISSAGDFEDFPWTELICSSDYIIMVLRADKVLSFAEKMFFEKTIKRYLAHKRCAVLIDNFERIEEIDREEVIRHVTHYTSSINASLPVYEYSTASVLNSQLNNEAIDKKYVKFIDFINKDLPERALELKSNTRRQAAEFCILQLMESINVFKNNLGISKEKIEKTIASLNRREKYIKESIENIKRKVQLFVNGSVRLDFETKINEFNIVLLEDIEKNIEELKDLKDAKKNMASYLEYSWKEFFLSEETWLKSQVVTEMTHIIKIMEADIEGYIEGIDEDISKIITNYLGGQYNFKTIVLKRREKDTFSNLTRYMNLGSMVLLFINLPWAIITFGSSQLLRYVFKDSIRQGEKEALIQAVNSGCEKLKTQVLKQVEVQFAQMTDGLKEQVENTYNSILGIVKEALNKQKDNIENSEELFRYLEDIEENKINEMKKLIAE